MIIVTPYEIRTIKNITKKVKRIICYQIFAFTMETMESKIESEMTEAVVDDQDDYDIEFCDDTDLDDDGDISTQKDTHSSALFSSMSLSSLTKENHTGTKSENGTTNNTKLHSFKILDIEVIYKLCSTTVLFKTETVIRLIQVSCVARNLIFILSM